MNLVNLILNIVFMQWYLGGHFIHYGIQFISYQLAEVRLLGKKIFLVCLNIFSSQIYFPGDDPLHIIFPKLTKCSLDMYGPSGSIINYDGLCVLPVNGRIT